MTATLFCTVKFMNSVLSFYASLFSRLSYLSVRVNSSKMVGFFFTFSADPVNPGNYFLGFSVPCCFTGNDVMLSTENFSRCFILIEFTPALFQLVIWDFHVFEQSNILEQ